MATKAESGTGSPDSVASLERLKQVETDTDLRLRTVRGKIDQTLAQLRDESESQVQAARTQAEAEAETVLDRAHTDAEAEAGRILREAQAALEQRRQSGPANLSNVWDDILAVLFDEFR